jgi:tetratricopeptide (TPR) repeat protein
LEVLLFFLGGSSDITTLDQYLASGQKETLVKKYLDEVVQDCGEENQQIAELVLYLLTDEKGTRPLKTRAEIENDLKNLVKNASTKIESLDLIFSIFVGSGLVLLLPEYPADRYQLVHDYLAEFIRHQQEPKLTALMKELEQERNKRREAETQKDLAEKAQATLEQANQQAKKRMKIGSMVLVFTLILASLIGVWARKTIQVVQREREKLGIEVLNVQSDLKFQSGRAFDALILALKAQQQLQQATLIKKEFKDDPTLPVSFSPDGKTLATGGYDGKVKLWNFDLADLLRRSCTWLEFYLVTHPHELEDLTICQNPDLLTRSAPSLMREGDDIAQDGNLQEAIKNYRLALQWNPSLNFEPTARGNQFVNKGQAEKLVKEGESLAREGNLDEAIAKFQEALTLDPSLDFEPRAKASQLVAQFLILLGESLAREGNLDEAIAKLQEALTLDPSLDFDPVERANEIKNNPSTFGGVPLPPPSPPESPSN